MGVATAIAASWKRMGKKGFFLTLLALLLTAFLALVFSARLNNPPDYKVELVENRVLTLNNYADNFFAYAQSVSIISGYSALRGVIQDIGERKNYNDNFTEEYPLCMLEGNLSHFPERACPGMQDGHLIFYLQSLTHSAESELRIRSNFRINSITVSQEDDPFSVELTINITLNVTDNFATIISTREFTSSVPIIDIVDPLFLVGSGGEYNKTFRRSNISKPEENWMRYDLEQIYVNNEYRVTRDGVSFINRVEGNFTASMLGLESVINHTNPSINPAYPAIGNPGRSMIDYLYWNKSWFNCSNWPDDAEILIISSSDAPRIPANFTLDVEHWSEFNLSSSGTRPAC